MHHDSAPVLLHRSEAGPIRRLIRRFSRWRHYRVWEYGVCNGRRARRNRVTGEVQFVLWARGMAERGYIYPNDWWHNFHEDWWAGFKADPSKR